MMAYMKLVKMLLDQLQDITAECWIHIIGGAGLLKFLLLTYQ